jgi:hypothetical protein
MSLPTMMSMASAKSSASVMSRSAIWFNLFTPSERCFESLFRISNYFCSYYAPVCMFYWSEGLSEDDDFGSNLSSCSPGIKSALFVDLETFFSSDGLKSPELKSSSVIVKLNLYKRRFTTDLFSMYEFYHPSCR